MLLLIIMLSPKTNAAPPPKWLEQKAAEENLSYVIWAQDPWDLVFTESKEQENVMLETQTKTCPFYTCYPEDPEQTSIQIKLTGCINQYISGLFMISSLHDGYQKVRVESSNNIIDNKNKPVEDRLELRVAGAIRSRKYGLTVGPLFKAGDFLEENLVTHISNYESIRDFPNIELAPFETIPFWFTIDAVDLEPGTYTSTIKVSDQHDTRIISIEFEILPIELAKESPLGVLYWASIPNNELKDAYMEDLVSHGANMFFSNDFSIVETGSKYTIIGSTAFHSKAIGWLSGKAMENEFQKNRSYVERRIRRAVNYYVDLAQEAGLDYNQWAIEIYDEPTDASCEVFAEIAKVIKKANPNVQIFTNPAAHWERASITIDKMIKTLEPYIDYWFPYNNNLNRKDEDIVGYLKTLDKPIGYYETPGYSSKNENAAFGYYRKAAMIAYQYDLDAFGFWAYNTYYGSPWDDFDNSPGNDWPDAAVVYPGPKGPITTRNWEAVREGIQDYKLVVVLEELIEKAKVVNLSVTASEAAVTEIADQFFHGGDLAIINNARARLFDEILKLQSLLNTN